MSENIFSLDYKKKGYASRKDKPLFLVHLIGATFEGKTFAYTTKASVFLLMWYSDVISL